MARHKVEISGVNTANIKVLTPEEQTELFIRYQKGDIRAKEELIEGNLKLVLSVLKKFNTRNENLDDLFQVGCIGLIKAIENFDLNYDVKFSTYSVPMIMGEVKRYLRDNNSIRISRSVKDLAYHALKKREELTSQNGKEPTLSEIATALGLPEIEITNALESLKDTISMFEPIYNDGSDTIYLSDQLEDKANTSYDLETRIALKEAITQLKGKEKQVLIERFIIGKTQVELAQELGISQAQVSRLEKSSIDIIKKMLN